MSLSLDKRLNMAAALVRENRFTVDVGTDHAYLPAFLVLSGKIGKAVASDVKAGPLDNASATIEKFGLEKNISVCLSDGLKNIPPFTHGDIVICGMGGNLISDILQAAPWVRSEDIHLVLQPMSHSEDVREWLCKNGFEIDRESAVKDGKHTYICLSAYYTGNITGHEPGYYYFGKMNESQSFAARDYIDAALRRIKKRVDSLLKASQFPEEVCYLKKVIEYGEKL